MKEILQIEKLCKSFGDNIVLDRVDLTLHEGENLVVMGKSGIGKTVLIKCIIRLMDPDEGIIRVFGEDILVEDMNVVNRIRRNIGFLFQGSALYDSLSVKENLEFPLTRTHLMKDKKKIRYLVEEALDNVGLLEALNKRPAELSGGMRKRIGLARTLILKPKIILYDEPTTGLDPITSAEISELINSVQQKYNAASIIITHDAKCAQITGNRICILHNGKFIAEGEAEQLRNHQQYEVNAYFN